MNDTNTDWIKSLIRGAFWRGYLEAAAGEVDLDRLTEDLIRTAESAGDVMTPEVSRAAGASYSLGRRAAVNTMKTNGAEN